MGFLDYIWSEAEKYQRYKNAKQDASNLIALAASRSKLVECKVCKKTVSELAAVCPNCGESLPGLRIQCPNCFSYHVTVEKKGFSVGQATAGAITLGALGLVAGMIGSQDSRLVCLSCNYKWSLPKPKEPIGQEWNIEKPKAPIRQSRIITDEAGNPVECQICHKNLGKVLLYLTTKGKVVCATCAYLRNGGKIVTQFYPRVKKLEAPYQYRDDIGKYRCEYCFQMGRYHYYKTLKGIKEHISKHPVHD